MYKYQNVSKETQSIVKGGDIRPRVVEPGQTFLSSVAIESPNFKYLGEEQNDSANVTGMQVTQPNQVSEASQINSDQTNKENE